MVLRGDKQARAAVHEFKKWHAQKLSQCGDERFEWDLATSPLSVVRRTCPHSFLYFLMQVLQRMLHQFWSTAQREDYVKMCASANGRCSPSIIAVLFYCSPNNIPAGAAVAIPDDKRQRLQYSEPARAAAPASSAAGSEAEAASGNAASVWAKRHDFWETFAENVMHHLVWPAVRKGVIRTAPMSHRQNPTWWTQGILPILDDPSVWSLYWLGGKRMARNSWYHVCDALGSYDFLDEIPSQPFAQKTVQEFLQAAGYRKAPGPAGVCRVTADTPPAAGASRVNKIENARREQANFARRCAYGALDQHVRRTLASANCCWTTSARGCTMIGQAFQIYRNTAEFTGKPLDPKAVVSELRLTLKYFAEKRLWPRPILYPDEWVVRRMPEYYAEYEDFGNEHWEALVNLMNLSSVMPSLYSQAISNASGSAVDGDRVHQTGVEGSKFEGNGLMRMLTHLLLHSEEEGLAVLSPDAPV